MGDIHDSPSRPHTAATPPHPPASTWTATASAMRRPPLPRSQAVRAEQFHLLYTHTPFVLALSLVNACVLAVAQRNVVPTLTLAIWLAYIFGVSAYRIWLVRHYQMDALPDTPSDRWERPFLVGTFLAGLGWGATGIWLFPADEPVHQMFVIFLLAGMTAGSVMSLSASREAFLAFALPTLAPTIIRLILLGTSLSLTMAAMGSLFFLLALVISGRMTQTILASLELRFDKELLIEDLTKEVAYRRQIELALQLSQADLEERVRERTEELAQANVALRAEIEERQRMALALQESADRFTRAMQGAQEGLWDARWTSGDWLNLDNPVYYSPRFKSMLGFPDAEFPNVLRSWSGRVAPEEWDRLVATLRRHLEDRSPYDIEFRMRTKSDELRWFSARGQAIWDEQGNPIHMSGSLRDITAHKDLEAQLMQAHKLEAVGRLAAGVAHDFNNLLTPILGYAEVLLAKAASGSSEARRLGDIRRAALHGAALVRQLLAFGRKQPVTPRVLDLNRELAEYEELLRRTLGEDIEVLYHLSPDTGCVKLDPTQLQQVILNLAVNARDAMPDGGCLTIETDNSRVGADTADLAPGRYVRVRITDTGAGMSPDVLSHVFEPFFTTKEVGKGSGLGLSVVDGIIGQAKGKITVASQIGLGTSFQILLPEADDIAPPMVNDPPAQSETGAETILVVEDNQPVRELTTHVLTELGYRVLVAQHGQDALNLAARHHGPISLLLTDVVMPGISGQELARRLEPSRPNMRVLYLSGHPIERLVTRAGDRPITPLLSKPFTSEELSRKVRQILVGQQTPS